MKTGIWTIVLWCCCLLVTAQTKYEVTANTFLNIRSHADANAPVLGTIDKGGEVDVYEISGGWAKIGYDNDYAYVSAQYLKKVESSPATRLTDTKIEFPSWNLGKGDAEWMVFPIVVLSFVLFLFRKSRGDEPLEDNAYVINCLLFLTVTLLELVYLLLMGGNAVWFCIPDTVGWMWTIIDFVLFGLIVCNQIKCFLHTWEDVIYNSYGCVDNRWGIYSWIGGIIASIALGIFFPPGIALVGVAFVVCQIIQVILIFKGIVPKGGWGNAFLCLVVYLLGALSTVLILAHFLVLLMVVLVAGLLLYLFGQSSKHSSRKCCENCSHYSCGFCHHHGVYLSNASNKCCNHYC